MGRRGKSRREDWTEDRRSGTKRRCQKVQCDPCVPKSEPGRQGGLVPGTRPPSLEITLRKAKPEFSHHPPLWGVEGKSKPKVTKFKPKMPKITRDFLPLGKNESSKGRLS